MIKHICSCGYIYNPKYGDVTSDINPGTSFDDLPDVWLCPYCGQGKAAFYSEDKKNRAEFKSLK